MTTTDLVSGENYPARREDYFTKATACEPGGECPQWLDFLDRITNRDRDLQDYLQRVVAD